MPSKSNKEDFIKKANLKHSSKYDYSLVDYVNSRKSIIIICKKHGEFLQLPSCHLYGDGCSKCAFIQNSIKFSSNTKEFIEKAILKHADKYDYSLVDYVNSKKNIIIICKEHGEFLQTPNSHLRGRGCDKCGFLQNSIKFSSNTKEFIEKANLKHGYLYDYSKVEYKNALKKVIIICNLHGEFLQLPSSHLFGGGCPKCALLQISIKLSSNTEEFIERAKMKHNYLYDYSLVDYVNSKKNIIIICKEHGEFLQTPNSHLRGRGCDKCGGTYQCNTEEWIEKAILKHRDKYDYSKVEYKKSDEKVIIICKKHGEFLQLPSSHLYGDGCSKCAFIQNSINRSSNTEEFIETSILKHGDKYDYSLVEYKKSVEKVVIICKEHGDFLQTPSAHLSEQGCIKCGYIKNSITRSSNTEEFIEKANLKHGYLYDYSKVEYKNALKKVIIICNLHGEFLQLPSSHLFGGGCPKCAFIQISIKLSSNTEEFIERAKTKHNYLYDYSKVEYKKSDEKVIIICKKHGEFLQKPNQHIIGAGCPVCVNKTEGKLYEKLKQSYPSLTTQFSPEWIGKKRFDFCIPEHKIIIELDGPQHFKQVRNWSSPEEQLQNDKEKEKLATERDYCVIRLLQEDVYYDTYDWFGELLENIQILIDEKPTIQNIYMDKNDEYECFYSVGLVG